MPSGPRSTPAHLDDENPPTVTLCRTSPGKYVFLEVGNCDGWIATDNAIELVE